MDRKCVGLEWRTDRAPPTKVLARHRHEVTVFGEVDATIFGHMMKWGR